MDKLAPFIAATQKRNIAVTVADPAVEDCPLVYVNPAFEALTGYRTADAVGKNCRFLQGAQTDEAALVQMRQAIADTRALSVCLLNYRPDGSPFHNLLFMEPIELDDGSYLLMGCQYEIDARTHALRSHVENLNVLRSDLHQTWRRAHLMRNDAMAMRSDAIVGLVRTYLKSSPIRSL